MRGVVRYRGINKQQQTKVKGAKRNWGKTTELHSTLLHAIINFKLTNCSGTISAACGIKVIYGK